MNANRDTVLSVAQLLISSLIKSRKVESFDKVLIREQVQLAATMAGATEVDVDALTDELARRFDVFVKSAAILVDQEEPDRWARGVERSGWRFWPRCRTHLQSLLPEPVVERIDEDTDKILELIGDPSSNTGWDRRGLVVGDVQFGKTSNYSALACKAADAGYKIIIVLAGIHESLRMQTQIRMDETFLGFRTDGTRALTGVGLLDPSVDALAATARSQKGDFNKIVAGQLMMPVDLGPPVLLVVKKNAMMLRNLHAWLERIARSMGADGKHVIRNAPALVIDDESDNASVDTAEQAFDSDGKPDLQHRPTTINGLIRKILNTFEQRSYVGYTATPFANIFIHHEGKTTADGSELFPKHFIVNLHAPSNYFGPLRAFGLDDEEDGPASQLIRVIDSDPRDLAQLREWVPPRHKQALEPGDIPDTLRRAILSFVVVCAVRRLRGQGAEHNSMLVHVTRYTKIQAIVYEQIEEVMLRIKRRLRFGDEGASDSIKAELKQIWDDDFVPTNESLRRSGEQDAGELPSWERVEAQFGDIVAGIRVKQINGLAQDVLDYDSYKDEGIDVIVVGGDKLSRGLTLPGLSVSYFTRETDMYDTLLQMGRWFGYRIGYLDLCRLYTTEHLDTAFEHIAVASDELRRDFDYMAQIGAKPVQYGLKVKAHPVLKPTSSSKRRHAQDVILYQSYAGGISESKSFSLEPTTLRHNKNALDALIEIVTSERGPPIPLPSQRKYPASSRLWLGVPWQEIRTFFEAYKGERGSTRARPDHWVRYVDKQIVHSGELTTWNVALVGGELAAKPVGGFEITQRKRERDDDVGDEVYRIKRLVTTRDAAIDFTEEQWNAALQLDARHPNGKERTEPTAHSICKLRERQGLNPLLMVYLPAAQDFRLEVPVVGPAVAFPGSEKAVSERITYEVNTVFQRGQRADEDDEPT
jgi:hypothetical protein